MPRRNLLLIITFAVVALLCSQKARQNRFARPIMEAMGLIQEMYVKDVDQRQLYENAMEGMVGGLDQYSAYIGPEQFQQFKESLDQEFGGIGIVVEANPKSGRITVLSPIVGTPAYEAGIQAGDIILAVEGKRTDEMSLNDSVHILRGEPGEPVTLSVLHLGASEPADYTIVRAKIAIPSVLGDLPQKNGGWTYTLQQDPRITYIRLTNFGEHTVEELTKALQETAPHEALILDLRDNAGGLLTAAVQVCDMFVSEGDIVSTKGRGGILKRSYEATPETLLDPKTPMVLLVNHYSASASEIVAACLQDHDRAAIVGQRTWGKGTVQNVISLEGGRTALKLTTASYWRPSNKNIHRGEDSKEEDDWGVKPNEGLEVILEPEELRMQQRWRRDRDILQNGKSKKPHEETPSSQKEEQSGDDPQLESAPDQKKETKTSAESKPIPADFEDRQLEAAIQYLQKKLAK